MLPNLLVIGAPKCGTSALHRYLAEHPQVFMTETKELNVLARRYDWEDHLGWYERQFDDAGDAVVRGESSPSYAMWPFYDDVPRRAASVLGDVRLIYLVRDPYDRTYAHWRDQHWIYVERRSLEEAVDPADPANPYVCTSRYAAQVERWLEHFAPDRLLLLL